MLPLDFRGIFEQSSIQIRKNSEYQNNKNDLTFHQLRGIME